MTARTWTASLIVVLLAGCSAGNQGDDPAGGEDTDTTGPGSSSGTTAATGATTTSPTTTAWWPSGILYRDPVHSSLAGVPGKPPHADLRPGGFDVADDRLVQGDNERSLIVQEKAGKHTVATQLYQVARASLDPTGRFAVVQAVAQPVGPTTPLPPDVNIYRIDLADGSAQRIGTSPEPEEGADWSPDGSRIAYSSFSPTLGIDLHVVDASDLHEEAVFDDAGGLHLSFSKDGKWILESGRLRVLDANMGTVLHDLRQAARDGIVAAGYELEDRYPGQANRGTFPLDGDFSPDGTKLVFDGAVKQGDGSAVVIATIALDGTGFEVVAGPFAVDPSRTNGLNYSETNPMWS